MMPRFSLLALLTALIVVISVGVMAPTQSQTPPECAVPQAAIVDSSADPSWAAGTIDLFTIDIEDGGHRSPVYALQFSPDGQRLASGSADQTIKLWDLQAGRLQHTLSQAPAQVTAIAFSPDGTLLASGGLDGSLRLWTVADGQSLRALAGHQDKVEAIAFSPDGQWLVTAGGDKRIQFWAVATGELVKTLDSDQWVTALAFSPDGTVLASGGLGKKVDLWNWQEDERLRSLPGQASNIYAIAFNPNGQTLAFSPDGTSPDSGLENWGTDSRNSIAVMDLEGRVMRQLQGHTDYVSSLAFSPSGQLLLSGSWDDTIRLWNVNTGAIVRQFQENARRILSVAYSPSGTQFASGSGDGSIKLFISQ